ncbi:unnamed protein product [Owenia fusiformis]|uniref:Uncharacterized protein n=1 Tax=Owenia fusiformis TaxID=6347 RepID=A0A8J1XV51_OWEFU|nr:unnamed protein product [Owenia fusiformis]
MKLTALCLLLSSVVMTTDGYKTEYLPGYYCGKDYKMYDDDVAVKVESNYLTSEGWTYRSELDKYECSVTFVNGNDDYEGLMMKFGMFKANCGDHIEIFSGRLSYANSNKKIMDCSTMYYSSVFKSTSGIISVRILSDSDTMKIKFNSTLVAYHDYEAYENCDVLCTDENVCIDKSLCKDGIDHCFDNSDEERYANCDATEDVHWDDKNNKWEKDITSSSSWSWWWGGIYSYAVIGGIVVGVISIIVSIVCCCIRYRYAQSRSSARTYTTPATSVTYAAGGGGYPVQPPPTVSYPPGSYPVQQPPPGSYPQQQQPGDYMQPVTQRNPNAPPPVYEELRNPTYDNAGETKANPV